MNSESCERIWIEFLRLKGIQAKDEAGLSRSFCCRRYLEYVYYYTAR